MKNYVEKANSTLSNQFHLELLKEFQEAYGAGIETTLTMMIAMSAVADSLKKSLFYGKEVRDVRVDLDTNFHIDMHTVDPDLFHGVVGLYSEAGELIEAMMTGDLVNLKEEVGDVLWYLAVLCKYGNFSLEDAMEANIAKLTKRFPNKFSEHDALNRDLQAERRILEES